MTESIELSKVLERAEILLEQTPGTNSDPQTLPAEDTFLFGGFIEQEFTDLLDDRRLKSKPISGSWSKQTSVGRVWLRRKQIEEIVPSLSETPPITIIGYTNTLEVPRSSNNSLQITQEEKAGLRQLSEVIIIAADRIVSFTPQPVS